MLPPDNYPELMVPEAFRSLIAGASTRSLQEMHRDIIFNTTFRQDLYAAQPLAESHQDVALSRFDGLSFCLTNLPERLPLQRTDSPLDFDLRPYTKAVHAVHAVPARTPASAAEIHRVVGLVGEEATSFLIQQLVVAGHLAPAPCARRHDGWMQLNSALISAGLRERWREVPLACCNTGTASYTETIHAVAIESAGHCQAADDAATSVLAEVRGHGHPINLYSTGGATRPATDSELLEHVRAVWRDLKNASNPETRLLRQFGILD